MQIGGTYTIDFAKVSDVPKFNINIKNNDEKRTIKLILLKNGEVLNLNNYTIAIAAIKGDKKDIFNNVKVVDANKGICEFEISNQMLVSSVYLPCEIIAYDANGGVSSSSDFIIKILKGLVNPASVVSSSEYKALVGAMSDVAYFKSEINKKADKDSIFTMVNMGQDIKEAMTGGSVAVVGENAVNTINVIDKSVDTNKLDISVLELLGVDSLDLNWTIGAIQNGNINPVANVELCTQNFIELKNDVKIRFKGNGHCRFYVAYYQLDGTFTDKYSEYFANDTIVNKESDRKIRISISYNDERVVTNKYELLQYISVIRKGEYELSPLENEIKANTSKIEDLQREVEVNSIPKYWENQINNKINKINEHYDKFGVNGASFALITDMHCDSNSLKSGLLLRRINDDCNIPYTLNLGDIVSGAGKCTKERIKAEIKKVFNSLNKVKGHLFVEGNHDAAYDTTSTSDVYYQENMTIEECYNLMYRKNTLQNNVVFNDSNTCFYVDDTAHKMRYIMINSSDLPYKLDHGVMAKGYNKMWDACIRQKQMDFICNKALATPSSDWSVVIGSHIPPIKDGIVGGDSSITNGDILLNVLNAYKNKTTYTGQSSTSVNEDLRVNVNVNFEGKGGNVICWVCGHVHYDNIVDSTQGIKIVTTLNDSRGKYLDSPTKTEGTDTEQAFDIFTINKNTRTVNITRIGAGADRSFTY